MVRVCKFCKSEFEAKYKSDTRQYCSRKCLNKCPERARKISESRKKLLETDEGKTMYQQAMKKRSGLPYYQRREGNRTRERDIAYGRTEYKKWRITVLRRDDWTCQECGYKGGILQAHHIKEWAEYPALRYDVNNGITLCPNCHDKIHGFIPLAHKVCPICGKGFKPHQIKQVCCSTRCAGLKRSRDTRKEWVKRCQQCEKEFFGYSHRKFCSLDCYHESMRTIEDKSCKHCSKTFTPHTNEQKCCSQKCSSAVTSEAARKVCPICLSKFSPRRKRQVCCSKVCADKKRKK